MVSRKIRVGQQKSISPLAIGKECAPLFREPYLFIDHGELLYDEKGLPK